MFFLLYMPFPSALSTLQIATSGLSWELQASCFVDYHSLLVIIFNVSLSLHCKFACDCSGPFFPGVLSTQENNNNSYRPVSDWRHLDFCDSVHGAVIQNDHFSRIQAGLPCLYLQFWNYWLPYHLFIILLPCGGITAYHCYHPNLRCDWIQTETHHSTRQPTPVKSTSTGTDEPQDINNACHEFCSADCRITNGRHQKKLFNFCFWKEMLCTGFYSRVRYFANQSALLNLWFTFQEDCRFTTHVRNKLIEASKCLLYWNR